MSFTMNSKRVARVIAIILAFLMLFSVLMIILDSVTANTATARVTQAEIDRLRAEKREQERRRQEIQSRINAIDYERMTEIAKKSVLDDRMMLTGDQIQNIVETIELYVVLIQEKEQEVDEAQARENAQLDHDKKRVRDMEESGVITYLEIIFDSTSFTDLLARLDFVNDIMRADERIYNNLIAARLETIAAKEDLERTMEEMEEEKLLLEERQAELEQQLAEAIALIEQIQAQLEVERALRAEVEAEEAQKQREINAKVEEFRRQQERDALARSAQARGTGELTWPVPGHNTVTSEFGIRRHPVFRVMRQHNGIDIGAPHGARVVASDTGTVILSGYNSSYGNYIVISHGNMTTLYAHLSSRGVREGDVVVKGDTIGRIGSTGISTGPHLHFEVSVNGSRVNPMRHL